MDRRVTGRGCRGGRRRHGMLSELALPFGCRCFLVYLKASSCPHTWHLHIWVPNHIWGDHHHHHHHHTIGVFWGRLGEIFFCPWGWGGLRLISSFLKGHPSHCWYKNHPHYHCYLCTYITCTHTYRYIHACIYIYMYVMTSIHSHTTRLDSTGSLDDR